MLMPLTAVVNFGSTLRFDKDGSTQSKKLNEMDLDDILSRAEAHENTQTSDSVGASLGGESFLAQFANVSDITNDMSWEDIIPLDERQKLELEEEERRLEESAANESRKRSHAQVSYEGMDVDQPAPPAAKKPKAPAAQDGQPEGYGVEGA
jgi:chromodomain-helicase-DNA-binding protein 1